jgi:hypothetical protein
VRAAIETSGDLRLVVTRAYPGVRPSGEVCVRCRCWTEWTENQIRASSGNGCKCLVQESYVARPRELEFPTFWLPRQTVPVKFTLIKSFRFKEWCAQRDDFRTFLGDFVAALPQIEFPSGLSL